MILLLFTFVAVVAFVAFMIFTLVVLATTSPYPKVKIYESKEDVFKDVDEKLYKFPNMRDSLPTLNLSVVIPAYNEELRLPPMLDECFEYLESVCKDNPSYKYEVIVVSDCSKDGTDNLVEKYLQKYSSEKVRLMKCVVNRGKGGAIRMGVHCTRGALILFADADGATKFADISKLENRLSKLTDCDCLKADQKVANIPAIAIGSRAHLEDKAIASRSLFRTFLMHGFHLVVWLFGVRGIRDTQCGFKLFTRKAADLCFRSMHIERWAFDVELLFIAQKLNIPIAEEAVNWTEIDGSKLVPVFSWIGMGLDLVMMWFRYKIGAWKLLHEKKE